MQPPGWGPRLLPSLGGRSSQPAKHTKQPTRLLARLSLAPPPQSCHQVMFVKVKEFLLEAHWTTATAAKKYSQWARGQVRLRAAVGWVGAGGRGGEQHA